MLREIVVVEGKSDTTAIRRALQVDTIETGGSALNESILQRIALAQARRGVIIFTDPDHAGERLRKIITHHVQGCKHAFLSQEKANRFGKIGIEYASVESIREAIDNLKTEYEGIKSQITMQLLIDARLMLDPGAASRRLLVGKNLGIGYCNGKQFLKRCEIFQISLEEFDMAIKQLDKEV